MIINLYLNRYLDLYGRNSLRRMTLLISKSIVTLCNKYYRMEVIFSLRKKQIYLLLKQKVSYLIQRRESKKYSWIQMRRKKQTRKMQSRERKWEKRVKTSSSQRLLIYLVRCFNHIKKSLLVYLNIYIRIISLLVYLVAY